MTGPAVRYEDIGADRPLFGEARPRDRVANLVVGAFTALIVTITLASAVIYPITQKKSVRGIDIYFGVCIMFILGSHLVLIYWYRQGDLEPKFRTLIYYNALTIMMLGICACVYIYNYGQV